MFLLLGLAESSKPEPDGGKVERHLRKVGPESKGYRQAQATIGDLYYKKGLFSEAEAAYENVLDSPSYEAQALSALGNIYVAQGRQASGESRQKVLFRKSSDMFNRLFVKYPLSPLIKPARTQIDFLKSQGIDASFALGEEEKLKTWEKTARDRKGTVAGARALLSLLRTHSKSVIDEKTRQVVKAPNYVASASACDSLLDEKTYTGDGFTVDSWHALRAEAAYQRAECEIASVSQAKSAASRGIVPKYLPGATAGQAIELFKRAKSLVDPKQLDLVKNIDIGLLEAMFKSSDKGLLAAAETKFVELEADYGNDARFQQLAIELADWYKQQGRLVEAAEQYAGVADRGQELDDDARMRLLYAAGGLYSKSAYQAQQDSSAKTYAIYVYPQEVIQLGGVLKTHRPLQETIQLELPKGGRGVRALDALVAVSKAANVPFVWTPEKNPEGVAHYLKQRRLDLTNGPHVARELLEQILDLKRHRLEFDIGLTGGTQTLPPVSEQDQLETGVKPRLIEIYDVSQADHRFAPLVRPYGAFDKVHGGGFDVTLFRILKRVEELSETRIVWAPGIDKDEMLAAEYKSFPGVDPRSDVRCAQTLRSVLEPLELRYRIIERRVADELYEAAFAQFNKIRQINPKSQYGEKSLFNLAINFYQQQDYQKMRIVLREYLKVFDSPDYRHYRPACFWVGWALEQEKNYRDAVEYYRRAAEERIVVYQPTEGETPPSKDELKGLLSYDLAFALMEPVKGQFSGASLSDVVDFIHLNTQVDLRLDPTAQTIEAVVHRKRFEKVPAWEVLHDVLSDLGLSFRVENVDKEIAQKAYYRLASTYEKDNLMRQALENCRTLLSRYPQTSRRSDTYRLMIDIHKGLKDYGNVLSTLEQYKASAGDELEKYMLDFEIGRIYFDMAAYAKAIESFRTALAAAKSASDRIAIRQGYAVALYRDGKLDEALSQFETLAKEETVPLRKFVADQMVFLLKYELGKVLEREYPEEFLRYIQKYERLSQEDRNKLSRSQFAKATWIYYVLGLIDLKKNRRDAALNKLNAVSTSPDDFLAADAAYRVGLVHMQGREFKEAREALEHLLFAMSSAESSVRATYALGICLEKLGKPKDALSRYQQLIERYPQSPYVAKIQQNPLYQKPENREQPKP
jgi:tetratricopeptide (TPR) repeat protein